MHIPSFWGAQLRHTLWKYVWRQSLDPDGMNQSPSINPEGPMTLEYIFEVTETYRIQSSNSREPLGT